MASGFAGLKAALKSQLGQFGYTIADEEAFETQLHEELEAYGIDRQVQSGGSLQDASVEQIVKALLTKLGIRS